MFLLIFCVFFKKNIVDLNLFCVFVVLYTQVGQSKRALRWVATPTRVCKVNLATIKAATTLRYIHTCRRARVTSVVRVPTLSAGVVRGVCGHLFPREGILQTVAPTGRADRSPSPRDCTLRVARPHTSGASASPFDHPPCQVGPTADPWSATPRRCHCGTNEQATCTEKKTPRKCDMKGKSETPRFGLAREKVNAAGLSNLRKWRSTATKSSCQSGVPFIARLPDSIATPGNLLGCTSLPPGEALVQSCYGHFGSVPAVVELPTAHPDTGVSTQAAPKPP